MKRELWVAGYPSFCGGADTELDHQIDLWRAMGIEVHLVPMGGCDERMRRHCDARGCHTHECHDGVFADKIVVSFCNETFLRRLPGMRRPARVIWCNCMTWLFPQEIECHRLGLIDSFGFHTEHQRAMLLPRLREIGPVSEFGYRPYFNVSNASQGLSFWPRPEGYFGAGRISRADPAKYPEDMWAIFQGIKSARPLKVFVAGWSHAVHKKCGGQPPGLNSKLWRPADAEITPVGRFYERLHVLIHKTGGSGENYPRVLLEAWASGVVVIAEKRYGFPELIEHGVTGYLCSTGEEMSETASMLAANAGLRDEIARNAHARLMATAGDLEHCAAPWREVLRPAYRGPGTVLKDYLGRMGITASENCSCRVYAARMDCEGPLWCRRNLPLIVGWLRTEAKRRGLPFVEPAVKALVLLAIRKSLRQS